MWGVIRLGKWKRKWKSLSRVWLFVTPWATQSMEFSRPEYWNGEPFPPPGDLPNPGIKPRPPSLQENSLPAEPQGKPKNTGVGSLSLLQGIFLTQELNEVSCIAGGFFTNWAIRKWFSKGTKSLFVEPEWIFLNHHVSKKNYLEFPSV